LRTNALGESLSYRYDSAGRLLSLGNENKASYHFKYDPLDRLIEEKGLDGIVSTYRYDLKGAVSHKVELSPTGEEIVTAFHRDSQGRLAKKEIQHKEESLVSEYVYDSIGQLTKASNATAQVEMSYDSLGRILTEHTQHQDEGYESSISHKYDALGNRIETLLPDGKKVNWYYSSEHKLSHIEVDGKVLTQYQRDALGRDVLSKRPNGFLD